jgi:hypothetical protein
VRLGDGDRLLVQKTVQCSCGAGLSPAALAASKLGKIAAGSVGHALSIPLAVDLQRGVSRTIANAVSLRRD